MSSVLGGILFSFSDNCELLSNKSLKVSCKVDDVMHPEREWYIYLQMTD